MRAQRYQSESQFAKELVALLDERPDLLASDCPSWTEGDCLNLAVALSAELGRPARPWVVVCCMEDGREHGCHVYVKLAGGTCVDGAGAHTEAELMNASYDWHANEQGAHSEQRVEPLQRWHVDWMTVDKNSVRALRQALAEHFSGAR